MSRPLIDKALAEIVAQAAKGDRITGEHLRRFLADPDRVLPGDRLQVEERLLFLLPKDHRGFERPLYEDGKLMYLPPYDGGWRIAVNGKIVAGTHQSIYGDDGSVYGAADDFGPTFSEGGVLYAYLGPDDRWWMHWDDATGEAVPLPGKPVMQPVVIAGKPACVTRKAAARKSYEFHVTHGERTYGPYQEVDVESLCEVVGGIGYMARDKDGKMSVFVKGHRVYFSGTGSDRWDVIRDLHCLRHHPEGSLVSELFSFITIDREGDEEVFGLVVNGVTVVRDDREISDLTVEEDHSGPMGVLCVRGDPEDRSVCLEGVGAYRSNGFREVRELSLNGGKPSFIAARDGHEIAVWTTKGEFGGLYHRESEPRDAILGLRMVGNTPLYIARNGDAQGGRYLVVFDETESEVRVGDPDHIRDYDVVDGRILQSVFDSEVGDDRVCFGYRKSRGYDRVFGFEVKKSGEVEFCAQRGRRIIICSFDPKKVIASE